MQFSPQVLQPFAGFLLVLSTMAKSALLIGCNYPGTKAHLFGCVNDAHLMKSMLVDCYGFKDSACTMLVDTNESKNQPTGSNIKKHLKKMVEDAKPGDILFMHFSGHGIQMVAGEDSDEEDGLDEVLVPTDMNLIADDDLRDIVKGLPKGVAFTFVADCCHSGGMLDHKEIEMFEETNDEGLFIEPILKLFGMESWVSGATRKSRSLAVAEYMDLLSEKTGNKVDISAIRSTIGYLFGGDASLKFQHFLLNKQETRTRGIDDGNAKRKTSCWTSFMNLFGGSKEPRMKALKQSPHEKKPPLSEQLDEEIGVLITGCQSNEKSADADPPASNPHAKAQGAMTNALVGTVRTHFKLHPGEPISNINLVKTIRGMLYKSGFLQHPSLEGSYRNASAAFVTQKPIEPKAGTTT